MKRSNVWLVAALMLVAASCGSDDAEDAVEAATDDVAEATDDVAEAIESGDEQSAADAVDDLVDELEEKQEAEGGGSASLTVGGQTYTFDGVLCAFGEEETGQVDAEFVLSAIANGTQLYFSIDQFGHSVSLNDIEDFENPSVSWDSRGEEFIQLDGRSASGEVGFVDDTAEGQDTQPGTFEGTCP